MSDLSLIDVSSRVQRKLDEKHGGVSKIEILQCFLNCEGQHLFDTREEHKTNPPTLWFIAETNSRRLLKIVFINNGKTFTIKTAYEPNPDEIKIYQKLAF